MMTPQNEAELAEMVAAANGPLQVRGGGTRPVGKPVDGAVISAAGLSGIVDYEPGALTLVVRAGTPVAEVEAALAAEGQRLPFEPMDHRVLLGTDGMPTVGGVVAANVSGPRRFSVGAARDFLLGGRFVDGAGRILKNGGRVMKNVTGYDLVKLMAGSFGTLGVLSEASFKVLPVPEQTLTLELVTADDLKAQEAMTRALTSPYEVSGAAVLPGDAPRVVLRVEGFAGSVAYRAGKITDLLAGLGDVSRREGEEANAMLWQDVRDVGVLARCDFVWRVSATARDLHDAILREVRERTGALVQLDWGGALAWVGMTAEQAEAAGGANAVHSGLQATAADRNRMPGGGHVTLIKGDADLRRAVPVFQPEPAPVAALTRGLRAKFDPKGIFNPGLMG
jgi:glycolate oxidase FAD binding subunit